MDIVKNIFGFLLVFVPMGTILYFSNKKPKEEVKEDYLGLDDLANKRIKIIRQQRRVNARMIRKQKLMHGVVYNKKRIVLIR